jgi:hypothetical protein
LGSWFLGFWETKAIAPELALPAKNLIVDAVRRGHAVERSDFEIALRILDLSEVKRLGVHALRVRPALQQRAMPGHI